MSKSTKSFLFVIALVITAVVAVMGWHWTDTAKTPFWWTFWKVVAILSVPAFFGLILWFNRSRKKW